MTTDRAVYGAWPFERCIVIVAHPDDEVLWAGGTILLHPDCSWTVLALCRKSDADRAARFFRAAEALGAAGIIGDLDDGPEQRPLEPRVVQEAILDLLPADRYDLILTHSKWGEYTRHRRHEEVGAAVMALREATRLNARQLRAFAYEDGAGKYLPRPVAEADIQLVLPDEIWQKKYDIVTGIYGHQPDSFEARATPRREAFWTLGRA